MGSYNEGTMNLKDRDVNEWLKTFKMNWIESIYCYPECMDQAMIHYGDQVCKMGDTECRISYNLLACRYYSAIVQRINKERPNFMELLDDVPLNSCRRKDYFRKCLLLLKTAIELTSRRTRKTPSGNIDYPKLI